MSLYKRGSVFWSYVWQDGVRHARSTGTGNRKLAEQIERQFQDELVMKQSGLSQFAPEMPFSELSARFMADGSPRPFHIERLKLLLPFWGDMPIGKMTRAHAREYRAVRHENRPSLSDTTVNRDLEALRHILFWAVDEGFLAANPLARVPMVRPRRKPRLVLNVAEEDKLLSSAADHLHDIIVASLDTGMRRGEILAQRWEHVDFDRRLICVTHSKTAGGEGREIPLTSRLFDLLTACRRAEGLVFMFDGKPLKRIKTAWKGAVRRASIPYRRFHDLRHTFNTRLMEAGVLADVRRALMGHSTGDDVNAIYTHIEMPAKRQAIQKLEAWVLAQRAEAQKGEQGNDGTEVRPDTQSDLRESAGGPERGAAEVLGGVGAHPTSGTSCSHRRIRRRG